MMTSHEKGVMYFSRLFFLSLESFVWKIVIFAEIDKVNYFSRMTKQCTEKTESDLDYQRFFPELSSLANIRNTSDDKSDEEEPTVKDSIFYSENICFVISNLWNKREEHINTNYAVTGWMLCLIPHIREYVFKNAQNKHHI